MASTGRTEHPSTLPPQANFRLIIDALADYANRTGIDLSKGPFSEKLQVSSSPDDILGLLEEHEKAFKEYREGDRRLIRCLSPVVTVIHAFSGILGEAVSLAPLPPAKAIFVGLDVLLTAATGVSSGYDALLELFECLTSFLKRLEIYTIIPPTTVMTDIILKIMVELLSVLALATKQINQGRFKKFARKLLGESEVEAVLQRLDRLTQDEARMTVAQTLGVVHGLMNNMKLVMDDGRASTNGIRQTLVALHQVVNEMNKMKRDQLQQEIQRWLSPPNPSTNHDFVLKARHKGTAAWFFEGNVLAEWKSRRSLLWIHGKPGSGKSTLLSAIIQDIEGMCAAGLASMAYYYFDFRDVKKQNIYGLLSSLLSQLSAELDSCHNLLSRLHSVNAGGARMPTSIALTGYIKDILSLPGQGPMYIVIDALDECPNVSGTPSAREEVLELVEGLVDLNLSNVYICVTSRPEIDIRMVLDPLKPLQISLHDESGQKRDIIEYVRSIVHSDRRMRRWREEDQKLVIDTLSEKADGMFRWVVCQIDRLRRNFPASIRGALDELPESLDQTYEQTLQGIDKEKRRYALRLFQCLSVSIRPLRVEELAEILAVRFDPAGSSTFNPDWRPVDAEEAVLSACSSLIAIVNVNDSQVVQFSHFSVKEFLTSDRLATADEHLSYYHILPEPAHITLAQSCLCALLHLDEKIDRNTIRHFPLSQYAAQYWIDHAQFRNVSSYVQDLMERLFDLAKPHFAAWIWLYDIDHHWMGPIPDVHPQPQLPEASPLYYASLCGFRGLVEYLIVLHPMHVNSKGGFHGTPLHVASHYGHLEIVNTLLARGVDVNQRNDSGETPLLLASASRSFQAALRLTQRVAAVDMRSDKQQTQLNSVAGRGSPDIVRLLIDFDANVTVADNEGWTSLHVAARHGHHDIAELLLLSEADLEARNKAQETPLDMACRYGRLAVARLLLGRGADLNCRDELSWTPLHSASRYGHLDVTKLLLERGADVNVEEVDRQTPLHLASIRGYLEIVRVLIGRGAAMSPRDNKGWTPFHFASKYGHFHVAKLLLECGVDVNTRNGNEETSLDLASSEGGLDIVRFLVGKGADIHARDNKGWNPLHIASKCGHLHVVRFLLECGVDVDIRNGNQETSLDLASGEGKLDVVRVLVEKGADIHVKDINGWNPLHIASKCGHLHVVKFLLECGVNVDIRNGNQETSLDLASSEGKLDVVHFLVGQGADIHARDNKGWNPLHTASKGGGLHVVKFLLECGIDVDIRNGNQETPLDLASGGGELDVAQFLVGKGADIHTRDNKGRNPLHIASQNGHLDVVQLLVDAGTAVDIRNGTQTTPLALALHNGEIEVSRFLIERGADLNTQDDDSWAPLHFASRGGHVEAVRLLLDCGVDPNIRKDDLWTPLHLASANGHLKVTRLLVQRGARLDFFDDEQRTPLGQAAGNGQVEIVRFLIDHGADLHTADTNGWTPLHASSRSGHLEVVKLLLRRGMELDVLDKANKTAAELASENDKAEVASFLVEYKADANVRNNIRSKTLDTAQIGADEDGKDEERASLHTVSKEGKVKMVKLLLDQGADINSCDHNNETPLHVAAREGHPKVTLLLTERGAKVDSRDYSGWTPLHKASLQGEVEVSRVLLDHGADVNARKQDYWTPLHLSACNGHLAVVKLLLGRGADVHMLNDEVQTPHQLSMRNGHYNIADILKEHGAGEEKNAQVLSHDATRHE